MKFKVVMDGKSIGKEDILNLDLVKFLLDKWPTKNNFYRKNSKNLQINGLKIII